MLIPSMKKITIAENIFGELLSRDVAVATNFVAREGNKLAYPVFIVCVGILQRMGISQRRLLH